MEDYGFSWFDIISLALGLLVPGVGALAGVWWRLNTQITTHREYVIKDLAKLEQATAVQIAALNMVIGDFKLEVARNYATNAAIKEVEDRIVQAIDRLGDRLDKFVDQRNR